MNAMEFFQHSTGKWRSQRTTHHLAFKRTETGESEIYVEALPADDSRIIEICQMHEHDPATAVGGAYVSWQGSMGWDKADESHEGTTVFALVPSDATGRQGVLLRERGYAEIVPVAGQYEMDDQDCLVLTTDYDSMSAVERFSFPSDNLRMRTSTVQRFGGFSTATFCTEFRVDDTASAEENTESISYFSAFG